MEPPIGVWKEIEPHGSDDDDQNRPPKSSPWVQNTLPELLSVMAVDGVEDSGLSPAGLVPTARNMLEIGDGCRYETCDSEALAELGLRYGQMSPEGEIHYSSID